MLRCELDAPLVVSVHGGDVLWTPSHVPGGAGRGDARAELRAPRARQQRRDRAARPRARRAGDARRAPRQPISLPRRPKRSATPLITTVGHLVARKRHADVLAALAELPGVRYLVIGDGPARGALESLASRVRRRRPRRVRGPARAGGGTRARERGLVLRDALDGGGLRRRLHRGDGGGHPRDRLRGRAGPGRDRGRRRWHRAGAAARAGDPRRAPAARCWATGRRCARSAQQARATVEREFTWERCGERTLAAYREALR